MVILISDVITALVRLGIDYGPSYISNSDMPSRGFNSCILEKNGLTKQASPCPRPNTHISVGSDTGVAQLTK